MLGCDFRLLSNIMVWASKSHIERAKKAFFKFIVELINILELIVFGKGNRIVFRK